MPEITHIVGRIAAAIFGAVAGAILTALAVWLICRFSVTKQPPKPMRKMLRILGAITGALAAILYLPVGYGGFGLGGFGLGLGPGGGGFAPSASQMASQSKPEPKTATEPDAKPTVRVRVVMLGGPQVVGDACYRIEPDRKTRTLADVREHIRSRRDASPPVELLEIVVHDDSLAARSAQVQQLRDWAVMSGLRVEVVLAPGSIPP